MQFDQKEKEWIAQNGFPDPRRVRLALEELGPKIFDRQLGREFQHQPNRLKVRAASPLECSKLICYYRPISTFWDIVGNLVYNQDALLFPNPDLGVEICLE